MGSILSIIGIIALLFFGKFVYDTFLTNNTERDWEEYKQSDPVGAARVEKNNGLDISTKSKSRETDKQESLMRIADKLNCSTSEVKDNFLIRFDQIELTEEKIKSIVKSLGNEIYEESKMFNIDPEDTTAALKREWFSEFRSKNEVSNSDKLYSKSLSGFIADNPEIEGLLLKSGDMSELLDYVAKNKEDLMYSAVENIAFANEPAEKYRQRALKKMHPERDFIGAIEIINKGLTFDEAETEPFLYNLRADCQKELLNYQDALQDMNKAIESILRTLPERYCTIHGFFEERALIRELLGDFKGAFQDNKIADEYFVKCAPF